MIVTTYLTLVLGELVPKQLALRRPEAHRRSGSPARSRACSRLVGPVVWLLGEILQPPCCGCSACTARRARSVTEEELKALLVEGAQTGVLETEERDMIERVLRLADKPVRAIMTPRTELAWIDRTDPPKDIVAALKSAPHSRFVVCDGSVDNVVGRGAGEGPAGPHPRRRRPVDRRGAAPADRGARHRHARWTRWSG